MRNYYDMVRSLQKSDVEPVIVRLVEIISEWKGIEEPYIKWRPLQQLTEKEQAEMDKLKADTENVKASTYQSYINAGILEPYEARYLEFGDSLDKIPVPEDLLPPVETIPEGGNKEVDEGPGKSGGDGEGDHPGEPDGGDEPGAIEDRIAELEGKRQLTGEEKKELAELRKKLKEGEK
jgi:hypothetical protein